MYNAICWGFGTGSQSTTKGACSGVKRKSTGKASALGVCSQGVASKEAGVGVSQASKAQAVGHSSLCARHGDTNGHGTAQETGRMDGCAGSALFPAHYGTRAE